MAVTTVSEVVQGVIQRIDRRTTSTNKPMLTIQVNNAKVSFFADADINQTVAEGQTVQFEREQRGKFWNGKNLHPVMVSPSLSTSGFAANGNSHAVNSPAHASQSSHPPLHELSVEELRALYTKIEAENGEAVLLGHISNQIRYAEIIDLLNALLMKP